MSAAQHIHPPATPPPRCPAAPIHSPSPLPRCPAAPPPHARYTVHPSNHPKLFSRAPGDSTVEDKRAELFKQHGRADHDPAAGHGHH